MSETYRGKVSSPTDWRTPPKLFNKLHEVARFQVDAAADEHNHLLPDWYGPGSDQPDALSVVKWASPAFCNPPYSRDKSEWNAWLDKFYEQSLLGVEIIALLPAKVETVWWAEKIINKCDIIFLIGRIPFLHPDRIKPSQPNHGSALCVFGPGAGGRVGWKGWKEVIGVTK